MRDWDVDVNVVVDNIEVVNVSIVDIVVVIVAVKIDVDDMVVSVVDVTDIMRRLKFWKNVTDWLSDWLTKGNY